MNETKITKGCPKCGRTLDADVAVCPYCGYQFDKLNAYYTRIKDKKLEAHGKYAGFLKRIISFLVDFIFIGLILGLIFILLIVLKINITIPNYMYFVIFIITLILYKIILESFVSTTVGKKLVGIKIETIEGEKIGFSKALIRNISIVLDIITLGIGYLLILFNKEKMALHDMVAKTIVVNDEMEVAPNDYAPWIMRLIAFALDLGILFGLWYLINLGINYVTDNYVVNSNILDYRYYLEYGILTVLSILYFAIGESGARGASIGKRILGMRIENYNGDRIGFAKSIFRLLFLIIEIPTLGFMLCLVSDKRQTLKDRFASTIVIRI